MDDRIKQVLVCLPIVVNFWLILIFLKAISSEGEMRTSLAFSAFFNTLYYGGGTALYSAFIVMMLLVNKTAMKDFLLIFSLINLSLPIVTFGLILFAFG